MQVPDDCNGVGRGFVFAIGGDRRYVDEALISIRSLLDNTPSANIAVFLAEDAKKWANEFVELDIFQTTVPVKDVPSSIKIRAFMETPYKETCLVDTDTFFSASPAPVFDLLRCFDVLASLDPHDTNQIWQNNQHLSAARPLNTGFVVYKKNRKTTALARLWFEKLLLLHDGFKNDDQSRVYPFRLGDQLSFTESLIESECRFYALPPEWNARYIYSGHYSGKVNILHGRGLDVKAFDSMINASMGSRVWVRKYASVIHENGSVLGQMQRKLLELSTVRELLLVACKESLNRALFRLRIFFKKRQKN